MPIYEYQCNDCGELLEKLQKVSDEPLQQCPACGEMSLRKKVSAAAFRLKGSGWYETDFKSGNKKNLAGDGDKPIASGDTKAGADAAGSSKAEKSSPASASSDSTGKSSSKDTGSGSKSA